MIARHRGNEGERERQRGDENTLHFLPVSPVNTCLLFITKMATIMKEKKKDRAS